MGKKPVGPMTPFDHLVTPPYLHTIKLLLPYIPPSSQRLLAVYIKFLELRNTMTGFRGFSNSSFSLNMLDELKPYMSSSEIEMAEQMDSMMNMLEMIRGMQSMSETDSAADPMNILKNIMTPEQQDMFDMYSNMFDQKLNHPSEDNKKGASDNE